MDPLKQAIIGLAHQAWVRIPQSFIQDLLKSLSEKEREIVELRFALAGGEKETLESIGKSFGLTRERVRQIEKNAIRKIGGRLIESPFGAMADTTL